MFAHSSNPIEECLRQVLEREPEANGLQYHPATG